MKIQVFNQLTKNLRNLVLYFVVNIIHKQVKEKTKEKYKRNGVSRGIPYRFGHMEFCIPSNVVCAESFKK
jgi:hypothetical protein